MTAKFYAFAVTFSLVYALSYVIAVEANYAVFTYHPALGEFGWGVEPPRDGPAMYWYGWMATAGIVAGLAGAVAYVLPQRIVKHLWPSWSWTAPLAAMAVFSYLLRGFFVD